MLLTRKPLYLITFSAFYITSVNATEEFRHRVVFSGDKAFAIFCRAAVSDDVQLLKQAIARKVGDLAVSRKRVLARVVSENGVKCNGQSLKAFSKQRHAHDVYAYISNHRVL
ncbi:DUF3718 domain-containing protein [Aestuariibacter sp. AA17]|uniref:DUF3718 domain-containing protein n=1 Tax=Fluctibacter corallii TaxID=2984329 RepID=A0ABT3A6N4_9ALTE|nr:DUF3718 domain-containing protein [Aestuariibacter sp. AA17]MCV2884011.1 DUF3718 domain-containing protein [Aestuariibacter sp. AA17]